MFARMLPFTFTTHSTPKIWGESSFAAQFHPFTETFHQGINTFNHFFLEVLMEHSACELAL